VSRSLTGDEEYIYRGVVEWGLPDGTLVTKYVGPFVNRVATLQAVNREIGSGAFFGWDDYDNRLVYKVESKWIERSRLTWEEVT
jgi:hypothetical protein